MEHGQNLLKAAHEGNLDDVKSYLELGVHIDTKDDRNDYDPVTNINHHVSTIS